MNLIVFFVLFAAAGPFMSLSASSAAAKESATQEALSRYDDRVLAISHRLTTHNAKRCKQTMPGLGVLLHSRDQYARSSAEQIALRFPNTGPLAAQTLLTNGPAFQAGIRKNSAILAINEWVPAASNGPRQLRLQAHDYLTMLPADQPVRLRWLNSGNETTAAIQPTPKCAVLVEVVSSNKRFARTNGPIIQISSQFVGLLNDEQLTVVLAHELAHSVLEHRKQLANNANGRSDRLRKEAEIEADRLSLHLLQAAGYDPAIGPAFWRSKLGRKSAGGIFRPRRYLSAKKRARLLDAEVQAIKTGTNSPQSD